MHPGPLLGSRLDPIPPDVTSRLRGWVAAVLDLQDDEVVRVSQLACRDSACAPTETVLAVLRPGAPISRVLPMPATQVCAADILAAFHDDDDQRGRA